ncbi:cysteine-rich receptor-like protein kinase 15 isoform X2 [Asparagus officinalis]|uniref:cysteine-rich receptor-like protein kinase 15 isoform X2 n=1 Tax=Asparagus officinalis TaxID=4686 RepID=UPI00098DE99C|nr:cysteine-rich receptor-like protein kinase 15 isoform X2 [Asparagus officinalis]
MGLLHLLLPLLLSPPSSAANLAYYFCENTNYTENSNFQTNLNQLLSHLYNTSIYFTFANLTEGFIPGRAYGLFLCRGDISPSDCANCIGASTDKVLQICPAANQATLWYDVCQLRYSDEPFFSSFDNNIATSYPEGPKENDTADVLRNDVRELMSSLFYQAANNSPILFATGEILYEGDGKKRMYGLVQCTRDLSRDMCSQCLQQILPRCCDSDIAGGILARSCSFRYGVDKFFGGTPNISITMPSPSPSLSFSPPVPPSSALNGKYHKRSMATVEEESRMESLYFDLSIIKIATANFSDINKLGQGGFGAVYKGMLPNGEDIAVKRLSTTSRQGIQELKNELLLVAKLQHRNLVRLRGICLEGGEKLVIYDYMPNGSLDKFLFDPSKCKELNWERRFKIIGGIARGLLYLHEESRLQVIHRDLKASNILLDTNMKPKISDFGLARLFGAAETHAVTKRVVGTFGYMAPEYARRGRFSTKMDVYSYGILVLEIVTGSRNIIFKHDSKHGQDLLSYAWKHWRKGKSLEIVDPSLGEDYSRNEVSRCIQIGLLCAQEAPADRPSMSSVFLMLNSSSMPLQDPLPPALLSTIESDLSMKLSSKQAYLSSTDESSANVDSVGSSQQSGPSVTLNPPEANQKGKERVQNHLIRNQALNNHRKQAQAFGLISHSA